MKLIEVIRGSDRDAFIDMYEDEAGSVPLDLTGMTVSVVFNTITPVATISDAVNGQVRLHFSDTMTHGMRAGVYRLRVKVAIDDDLDGDFDSTVTPDIAVRLI